MGEVYLARELAMEGRNVAIKIAKRKGLRLERNEKIIEEESKILISLTHPHINRIIHRGIINRDGEKMLYIVLEYISGHKPIYAHCQNLSNSDKLVLYLQACSAVHAAHRQGIIHCDISGNNVLVDNLGNLYVTDFGLAMRLSAEGYIKAGRRGTKPYISPEADLGQPLDARSDIFSLGVLLYILFENRPPYQIRHSSEEEVGGPNHNLVPLPMAKTPRSISAIIRKAIAINKEDRFANVQQLIESLLNAQQHDSNLNLPITNFVYEFDSIADPIIAPNFSSDSSFRVDLLNESIQFAEDQIINALGQLAEKHSASSAGLFIRTIEADGEYLTLDPYLSHNLPPEDSPKVFQINRGVKKKQVSSIVAHVAETGRPYICYDVKNDRHYHGCQEGIQSELAIPIYTGDGNELCNLIGVINLESNEPNAFLPTQISCVAAMATSIPRHIEVLKSCRKAITEDNSYAWHPELFGWSIKKLLDRFTSAASTWLAELLRDGSSQMIAPPSCSIWHCARVDNELFVLSTSRFDHEYAAKFTLPLNSFTGSLQSIKEGEVVFIDDPTTAPNFVRKGKVSIMGVEAIYATPVNVSKSRCFEGFNGSISVYLFRNSNSVLKNSAKRQKLALATRSLAKSLSILLESVVYILQDSILMYTHEELNCKSMPGISDQSGLVNLIAQVTQSSACTIFAKRKLHQGSGLPGEKNILQGLASTSDLIDANGEITLPKYAIYNLDTGLDEGLTVSISRDSSRIIRLNSTEPNWRMRISNLSRKVLNKFREKFALTESEHRPFIGCSVKFEDQVVGVIRAVRKSDSPPYSVFEELILSVVRKACASKFKRWSSFEYPTDLKLNFNLGVQFPFAAKLIKGDHSSKLLRSLRRIASPFPEDVLWSYRHLDALLDDLLTVLSPLRPCLSVMRIAEPMSDRMRIMAARSPFRKNPLGAYEFSIRQEGDVYLEMEAMNSGRILSQIRPSAVVGLDDEIPQMNRSICFPFTIIPEDSVTEVVVKGVITLEFLDLIEVIPEILSTIHLAVVKLSMTSRTIDVIPPILSDRDDWLKSMRNFCNKLIEFEPNVLACDIKDVVSHGIIARCSSVRCDNIEAAVRGMKTRLTLSGEELAKASRYGFVFRLLYGGFKSNYEIRCLTSSTLSRSNLRQLISRINSSWQQFTLSKTGFETAPLFYSLFTRESEEDDRSNEVWKGESKCRISI